METASAKTAAAEAAATKPGTVEAASTAAVEAATACKFACNNDPLRGDFRVQ
jgi:hypothetical protein